MARCGRCGLWAKTPKESKEQKYAGTCLWYQIKLEPEFEYQERKCEDFFEKIEPFDTPWHFDYKIKRDNLGEAYQKAKQSDQKAKIAVSLSLISIFLTIFKILL